VTFGERDQQEEHPVTAGLIRLVGATIAFVAVAVGGIVALNFNADSATASWVYLTLAAFLVALVVYAAIEYAQTRAFRSITSQFDTRTIVLIPIAIAFNIILGQAVGAALKIPIYLDSIGTILVGALAGPIPGALTGLLSNVLWSYAVPPPFHSDIAGAFAVVAMVIGLLAGFFARIGWLRPRPNSDTPTLLIGGGVALAILAVMAWYAYSRFYGDGLTFFNPDNTDPLFVALGWGIVVLAIAAVVGFFWMLLKRRDLTVAYVVVAGVVTGVIAALISAPISANLFSGVTGAGTDFLVAAFRQGGSDIQTATFQQGLLSDPIDKLVTFLVVYVILGAMAVRTKARFPQGEKLVNPGQNA
jgi:energy-coupling factor transport system substrate-specific component